MTNDLDTARRDLAYLRSLTEDSRPTLHALGALLVVGGAIQTVSVLRLWAVEANWLDWPDALRPYMGIDGVVLQIVLMILLPRLNPGLALPSGSASLAARAIRGAINALAWALAVAVLGLLAARWRLEGGEWVSTGFPIILFALTSATWQVIHVVYRRRWAQFTAVASATFVLAMGLAAGDSAGRAILAAGFLICFAAPGAAMMRQSRAEP